MEPCACKEKIVLEKGDASFIAYESWCPKHGYYTSCYICNPNVCTTETCGRKHDPPIGIDGELINTMEDFFKPVVLE